MAEVEGPRAAVIVPHYNDVVRLKRCLDALMPQMRPDVELMVVDNASTDELLPISKAYPDLNIVVEPNKGAAAARNRGVKETQAPLIFFLDCDCVPAGDWLQTAFDIASSGDVIGGRIDVFDETPAPRNGAEAFETVFAFDNRAYVERDGFSVTANLVTTREVFEATGPLVVGVSEDLDWCRRATAKGFSLVYEDRLRVEHPSRNDWTALVRKWRRLTSELYGVHRDGGGSKLSWALRGLAMPASAIVHARQVLSNPALRDSTERRRGVATLLRLRCARMIWMLRQVAGGNP